MADQITTNPNAARDVNGEIVPAARMFTYLTGTTTPVVVFQDVAGTIPHATPILADGNGVFPQIFYTGVIKVVVTDPDGVTLPGYPLDPAPRNSVGASGASTISFSPTEQIPETNVQAAIEAIIIPFGAFGDVLRLTDTPGGARTAMEAQQDLQKVNAIELGRQGSGDRTAVIDLHASGAPEALDFSARILRAAGVNGNLEIVNTGTGLINFTGSVRINGDDPMATPEATVLLGVMVTTSGSTVTLSGLTLTGYKFIRATVNSVTDNAGAAVQRRFANILVEGGDPPTAVSGTVLIDLANSVGQSITTRSGVGTVNTGAANITNASTSISFTLASGSFNGGSIRVYGVR